MWLTVIGYISQVYGERICTVYYAGWLAIRRWLLRWPKFVQLLSIIKNGKLFSFSLQNCQTFGRHVRLFWTQTQTISLRIQWINFIERSLKKLSLSRVKISGSLRSDLSEFNQVINLICFISSHEIKCESFSQNAGELDQQSGQCTELAAAKRITARECKGANTTSRIGSPFQSIVWTGHTTIASLYTHTHTLSDRQRFLWLSLHRDNQRFEWLD